VQQSPSLGTTAASPGSSFGQPPRALSPGAFPIEYVPAGESLIYETKPSLWAFVSPITTVGLIALFFLFFASYHSSSGNSFVTFFDLGGWFLFFLLVFIPLIALIGGLARWWASSYAITNRRAMMSRGIVSRNVVDCTYDKIQNVNLHQGIVARMFSYGNVVYQTAGISSLSERAVLRSGGVYWLGVKDPVNTRRFVNEVSEHFRQQQRSDEFQQMAAAFRQPQQVSPGITTAPASARYTASKPVGTTPSSSASAFCSACGTAQSPGARFCKSCGSRLG